MTWIQTDWLQAVFLSIALCLLGSVAGQTGIMGPEVELGFKITQKMMVSRFSNSVYPKHELSRELGLSISC